jgi:AMP nucleosidase
VKTETSDANVSANYLSDHLKIGIDSLKEIQNSGNTVKHLKF